MSCRAKRNSQTLQTNAQVKIQLALSILLKPIIQYLLIITKSYKKKLLKKLIVDNHFYDAHETLPC